MFSTLFTLFTLAGFALAANVKPLEKRDSFDPARVPYVLPAAGTDPIADEFRARDGGVLRALDGVLLNAELVSSGWFDIGTVIRFNNSIPDQMRETMILRSATLNAAAYQWLQHEDVGRSVGLTTPQLLEIRLTPPFLDTLNPFSSLSPELQATMLFTDHLTLTSFVPDDVFNNLKKFLTSDTNRQLVEAVSTVGLYSYVSRFLRGLNVDGKMSLAVPIPK